jgi:hypothetical protein
VTAANVATRTPAYLRRGLSQPRDSTKSLQTSNGREPCYQPPGVTQQQLPGLCPGGSWRWEINRYF